MTRKTNTDQSAAERRAAAIERTSGEDASISQRLVDDAPGHLAPLAHVVVRGSLGSSLVGRENFLAYVERVRDAFPDWHNRVDEIVASNDRVVTRMTWSGTHRGQLGEIEPTGAHVEYGGAAFFRLTEGTIQEAWVVGDTQELWRALGKLDDMSGN